jgi:hypothetical protein
MGLASVTSINNQDHVSVWAPLVAALVVCILAFAATKTTKWANDRSTTKAEGAGPKVPRPSSRGGLFHGYDYRVSTSKTMAALWTMVVAFMVVDEALIAVIGHGIFNSKADFAGFMASTLDNTANNKLYLVFLGGPYGAAVAAKAIVTTRVNNGTLQKTDGTPNTLSDLVSNDAGAVDLYDFQYTLFNFVALATTVAAFCASQSAGLPALPDFMAILAGGSALTYTVNKGVSSNQPTLTAVHPQSARVGDIVTVYGNNLTAVSASNSLKVSVAGVDAKVQDPPGQGNGSGTTVAGSDDEVAFVVPAPSAAIAWTPTDHQQVSVTTVAGLTASLNNALAVVPDKPVAVSLSPACLVVTSAADLATTPLEMRGTFLAAPGVTQADAAVAQVTVSGSGTTRTTTASYVDSSKVSFTLPANTPVLAPGTPAVLQVQLSRGTSTVSTADPLTLTVQVAQTPQLTVLNPGLIVADPGASLAGQVISLTGAHLLAESFPAGSVQSAAAKGALKAHIDGQGDEEISSPGSDTQAEVKLTSLTMPQTSDGTISITLQRGSLSSEPLALSLRPRWDGAMAVDPITAPAGTSLAGQSVSVRSDVLSATLSPDEPGRLVISNPDPLVAQVCIPGRATPFQVEDLVPCPDSGTPLTFNLPAGTVSMPDAQRGVVEWTIKIQRSGHLIGTGTLALRNQ